MSSTYHLICLSHDPALVIYGDDDKLSYADIQLLKRRDSVLTRHRNCDIVAGRFSYPLIEVGCYGKRLGNCPVGHTDVMWVDRHWLILLSKYDDVAERMRAEAHIYDCWPFERLNKLRLELGLGDSNGA